MNSQTLIAFTAVAGLTILSPGPAVLLTLRNGASFGVRSVFWSALGTVSGIFCLALATILGLGVVLNSSALLFASVKLLGALYLFYIGGRHLFAGAGSLASADNNLASSQTPKRHQLYREAFLTTTSNPKALVFFTALFPQFISPQNALLPQFFMLTGIFMTLSYLTHIGYALLACRVAGALRKPVFALWLNRLIGLAFLGFGALVLMVPRQLI